MTMATGRSHTAGKFLFGIDGVNCGYLQSFEGCNMEADLATHKSGGLSYQRKHATTIKWTPAKVRTGAGMSKALYEWIQSSFDLNLMMKDGFCTSLDFNHRATRRVDFHSAMLTKFSLPGLGGEKKDSLYYDLEIQAERAVWKKEGNQVLNALTGDAQKNYHVANWRFEVGGLDCKRIAQVDGISWECKVVRDDIGDGRENTYHPVEAIVSDITVKGSVADAESWAAKAYDFLVKGNCLAENEMTASVELMSPNFEKSIATLEFQNVGFKSFSTAQKREANAEAVERFEAKLYCEHLKPDRKSVV